MKKKDKKDKKDKKSKKEKKRNYEEEIDLNTAQDEQPPQNLQVFVSGIPYEANEAQLREFFNQGENKNLSDEIKDVKLPLYQDSGKCRGFAHVEFSNLDFYTQALALTGKNLGARYLEVKEAAGRQSIVSMDESRKIADAMPEDCRTLFVKNLPYEFKEDDIGDRFRPFGEIKEIRISKNW